RAPADSPGPASIPGQPPFALQRIPRSSASPPPITEKNGPIPTEPTHKCPLKLEIAFLPHPHLLYPQFKQVAQPSMITRALVLHLWHMVALGGKLVPSPVTATSSSRAVVAAVPLTAALAPLARS